MEQYRGSSAYPWPQAAIGGCAGTTAEAEPDAEPYSATEMEGVRLRRWAVSNASHLQMEEGWQPAPGKWALTQREMDMIDLGGAEP